MDSWFYDFLYDWHIPAFVIVTGYLSRSFAYTRVRMWSLVTTVAVPYVLFEGLLALFRHTVGGVNFERLWANPHWPMWYLAAMFFWRLMTPIFKRMPGKVVVAVAISLVAGLYATDLFDNARIFGLLPFFVLGLKMHEGHWNLLRTRRARWFGFAGLTIIFVLARFQHGWLESEWLYYRSRYDALDHNDLRAMVIRMGLLLTGLVGSFSFFAVVPRTKTWFSTLGGATLVVYLFHGFVVLERASSRATRPPSRRTPGRSRGCHHGPARSGLALFLAWPPVVEPAEERRRPGRGDTRASGRRPLEACRSGPQRRGDGVERHHVEGGALAAGSVHRRRGGPGTTSPPRRVAVGGAGVAGVLRAASVID